MALFPNRMGKPRQAEQKKRGYLDPTEAGQAKGWAFDSEHPEARAKVEISIDGQVYRTVEAGEYRPDLEAAGFGDGRHAFALHLPEGACDGRPHTVEAKFAGTDVALANSPRVGVFAKALADPAEPRIAPAAPAFTEASHASTLPESALSGLSVVIVTQDRAGTLERSLNAFAGAARNLEIEFVVVDNGSADGTSGMLETLASRIPSLKWVTVKRGPEGVARNTGVAMAQRELILFLGDDVTPATAMFFQQHLNAHRLLPGTRVAVLGKVAWPNLPEERVSFLMAHVRGAGGQQFGFGSLLPYTWLDWRFFSTANFSFKKSVIQDWARDGFSAQHKLAESELGYRLDTQLPGGLQVLYCPAASATHESSFTVRQCIERLGADGAEVRRLVRQHPGAAEKLGVDRLERLLQAAPALRPASGEDLLRMIEGAKSWGVVIESNYQLGSQNWHADLLDAIFELSYLQGYVMAGEKPDANHAAAYQYCIERFQEKLSTAASFEAFGRFPSFSLT